MVQWFLFDGVNLQSCGRTVAEAIELAALVHTNETETALPFADVAVAGAQIAVHTAVRLGFPPAALVHRLGFLQNLQVLHEILGGYPGYPLLFLQEYQNKPLTTGVSIRISI